MTVNVTISLGKSIDIECWVDIGGKVEISELKRNAKVTRESHTNGH